MNLLKRLESLCFLGSYINDFFQNKDNNFIYSNFNDVIENEVNYNPWFTRENVEFALKHWGNLLQKENLEKWINLYEINKFESVNPKNVLIIAAGNIPLVSFHDIISVFITGHYSIVKTSSKDSNLLKTLLEVIKQGFPEIESYIKIQEGIVNKYDAVIATGGVQSQRYFEYYFGKYPHIFRSHKNSVAILRGDETFYELEQLSNDVFRYFGLGCRSVSKLYVPQNYNFDYLIEAFKKWEHIFYHHFYLNNFDYQKTIYILNKISFKDAGFYMLKESEEIYSPIGVIFYEYYSDISILASKLKTLSLHIQCIVSKENKYINSIPFGMSQKPNLWDYADNVDVVKFLIQL